MDWAVPQALGYILMGALVAIVSSFLFYSIDRWGTQIGSPRMKGKLLIFPVILGCALAAFTAITFYSPNLVPDAIGRWCFYFVAPGLLLGLIASGNVHDPSIPVAMSGNFLIYFGVAYIIAAKRNRSRNKSQQTR